MSERRMETLFSREKIEGLLGGIFGQSAAGDEMHHALLGHRRTTALGVPDLKVTIVVIADMPRGEPPEVFVGKAIAAAGLREPEPVYLAAVAMEVHTVTVGGDEASDNRARRLHADGQLRRHELAVEQTMLYAAAADGRRWHGAHRLTGPDAGAVDGPHLLAAGFRDRNDYASPLAAVIRRVVGLPW